MFTEICGHIEKHPRMGGPTAVYKFGSASKPKVTPAPSPIPRRVEVDVAAAEREEITLASQRRGRRRTLLTRGTELGELNLSQSELLGV